MPKAVQELAAPVLRQYAVRAETEGEFCAVHAPVLVSDSTKHGQDTAGELQAAVVEQVVQRVAKTDTFRHGLWGRGLDPSARRGLLHSYLVSKLAAERRFLIKGSIRHKNGTSINIPPAESYKATAAEYAAAANGLSPHQRNKQIAGVCAFVQ